VAGFVATVIAKSFSDYNSIPKKDIGKKLFCTHNWLAHTTTHIYSENAHAATCLVVGFFHAISVFQLKRSFQTH
jgi:hypothetical protein